MGKVERGKEKHLQTCFTAREVPLHLQWRTKWRIGGLEPASLNLVTICPQPGAPWPELYTTRTIFNIYEIGDRER